MIPQQKQALTSSHLLEDVQGVVEDVHQLLDGVVGVHVLLEGAVVVFNLSLNHKLNLHYHLH